MRVPRRQFLQLATCAATVPAASQITWAQPYPSRLVRIVVGAPPGGPVDISARLIGQWLSERLGQPFVIENRPGAGGNTATEAVVRAPADGHTLLLAYASSAINATLFDKLNYDFTRDIAPVASLNRIPLVLEVHPTFPAKTVLELIAYARENPGKVSLASPGNGTGPHVAGELFKMMTGVNVVHVPYRGSPPMLSDLLGGHVQVAFDGLSSSIEHIKAGKLRALAVATARRLDALPDVPIVADAIPGFEASGWCGVVAPKSTSAEIVDKLNKEINAGLADPKIVARLTDLGTTPFASTANDFGGFISDEIEKWAKVVRFAGLKPDY
jgi:tripartite-type tricarboxylate transporter receptor subunit TctC